MHINKLISINICKAFLCSAIEKENTTIKNDGKIISRKTYREIKHKGYGGKQQYILNAINLCNATPHTMFHYYVSESKDRNGVPCILVIFRTKLNMKRYMLAFHIPLAITNKELKAMVGKGQPTHWSSRYGGMFTLKKFKSYFDLKL